MFGSIKVGSSIFLYVTDISYCENSTQCLEYHFKSVKNCGEVREANIIIIVMYCEPNTKDYIRVYNTS